MATDQQTHNHICKLIDRGQVKLTQRIFTLVEAATGYSPIHEMTNLHELNLYTTALLVATLESIQPERN